MALSIFNQVVSYFLKTYLTLCWCRTDCERCGYWLRSSSSGLRTNPLRTDWYLPVALLSRLEGETPSFHNFRWTYNPQTPSGSLSNTSSRTYTHAPESLHRWGWRLDPYMVLALEDYWPHLRKKHQFPSPVSTPWLTRPGRCSWYRSHSVLLNQGHFWP